MAALCVTYKVLGIAAAAAAWESRRGQASCSRSGFISAVPVGPFAAALRLLALQTQRKICHSASAAGTGCNITCLLQVPLQQQQQLAHFTVGSSLCLPYQPPIICPIVHSFSFHWELSLATLDHCTLTS